MVASIVTHVRLLYDYHDVIIVCDTTTISLEKYTMCIKKVNEVTDRQTRKQWSVRGQQGSVRRQQASYFTFDSIWLQFRCIMFILITIAL